MIKLFISTALAALLAASGAAFAQSDHRDHGRSPQGQAGSPSPRGAPRDDRGSPPAAAPAAAPAQAAPAAGRSNGRFNGGNSGGNFNRARPTGNFNGPRPGTNAPRFAPNRNFGSRPEFNNWRRNFSAPRRFHAPSYRRPSGWYAHRWVFGEILPSFFWAPDYWISDFGAYALPPPPPGTVWVRDGDDALLIDRASGEIIQVEYSVFY